MYIVMSSPPPSPHKSPWRHNCIGEEELIQPHLQILFLTSVFSDLPTLSRLYVQWIWVTSSQSFAITNPVAKTGRGHMQNFLSSLYRPNILLDVGFLDQTVTA